MTRALYDRRLGGMCDEAHKGRCGDHRNQGLGARVSSQAHASDLRPQPSGFAMPACTHCWRPTPDP